MKILFCINDPIPPFRQDVLTLFGKYAHRLGLSMDLWAQRADRGSGFIGQWEAGRTFAAGRGRGSFLNQIWRFLESLRVFWIDLSGYDALQVRDRPWTACFWLLAARLRRKPFFYWMSFPDDLGCWMLVKHSTGLKKGYYLLKGVWMHCLLRGVVFPFSNHMFVQSDRLKEMIANRYGTALSRMTAVPMGVDLERVDEFLETNTAVYRPSSDHVLAYLGAMDSTRELDILIDSLVCLKQRGYESIRLLMMGSSGDGGVEKLKHRAAYLGVLDQIEWTGWLPLSEAWRRLQSADIALSMIPARFDFSSPTKLVEYMAMGMACVASVEIADQRVLMEESRAGLLSSFSPERCAEAIIQILSDPQKKRAMQQAGPAYIRQNRAYDILAKQVVDQYRYLLGKA